jgi:hypothetical protein
MNSLTLACPLCRSTRIRVVATLPKLRACACDACNAQFTILVTKKDFAITPTRTVLRP